MVDVLVIGGGNAALCAALMAREAGASVLLLEAAPREWRGGNSQHTRNLRCMHDAPQDVLVDAYPEEEYWQDLLKVTGGHHRRKARASRDSRIVVLPRLDAPSRRAFSAAALRRAACRAHQRVFHGRRQGARQRLFPQRRSTRRADSLRRACRFDRTRRRPFRCRAHRRRTHRSTRVRAGCRRLRVESRVAARGLGASQRRMGRRKLPDSRNALQHGRAAQVHDRCRRGRHRRSVAVALRGDRRARAALRRRHLHAHGLRLAWRGGQPERGALLRRGRGFLAETLCDLGPPRCAAARPDCLVDHRFKSDRPFHAARFPRHEGGHARRTRARERVRRSGVRQNDRDI